MLTNRKLVDIIKMQIENYLQKGVEKMTRIKLSREKIDIQLGNNLMSITELAKVYGCSRARINVILNSREVTPMCAGRLAKALNVKVEQIME